MAGKKGNPDYIDHFLSENLYIPTRTIYLGRDDYPDPEYGDMGVDHNLAAKFIKNLHILEHISTDPITVYLNTPGGDEYQGMAIYDAIKLAKSHLTIIGTGQVASMGAIILQAADERLLTENAIVMFHEGTTGHPDDHPEINKRWMAFDAKYGKKLDKILFDRINEKRDKEDKPHMTKQKFKELNRFDTILTAEETIELGLADKILEE